LINIIIINDAQIRVTNKRCRALYIVSKCSTGMLTVQKVTNNNNDLNTIWVQFKYYRNSYKRLQNLHN